MKKYLQIIKITFEEYFVYRLNFLLWRFRSFIFFLTLFFFWSAVYQGRTTLFGYQKSQMFFYLIGVAFLKGIVFSSRSIDEAIAGIRNGSIGNWLLRPINIFKGFFARDLAPKTLDFLFCCLEILLVLLIFRFPLYFPQSPAPFLFFILSCLLSIFLYFYLLLFLAGLAFWTDRIWAIRWLFSIVLLQLLSGEIFPLDVLPAWLFKIIQLTPFPYLIYFPLNIWLERINGWMVLRVILVMFGWIIVFKRIAESLWQKGLREYSAYGG